MKSTRKLTRRNFIIESTAATAGSLVAGAVLTPVAAATSAPAFRSAWHHCPDRVWLGAEYWANPLQDWRIQDGRAECVHAALGRNVHLLTRQLGTSAGTLQMRVRLGRIDGLLSSGRGSAGFSLGVRGPLEDYRNSLFFGQGLDAGITAEGGLFIGPIRSATKGTLALRQREVELRLEAEPTGSTYRVRLAVHDARGASLGEITRDDIRPAQLEGNLALVANFGPRAAGGGAGAKKAPEDSHAGTGPFWFADWRVSGTKLVAHEEHAFGPILFTQYTLSRGILKLTAQMPPVGAADTPTARLEIPEGTRWTAIAEEPLHPTARTVTFRIAPWNAQVDRAYRVAYTERFKDAPSREAYWQGVIRRDPRDQAQLSVLDVSCNIHTAFPNRDYVANAAKLNPDFIAFTGDQFYESTAGYGVQREPLDKAMLDYLRKWYAHGWTWRELTKDRPSISIPDDHDVYQGNLWGEGGEGRQTTQAAGGYDMPAAWVNGVHHTQTSHHPDPYEPDPGPRGTTHYYGPLTYGGISFAVLADRQYKSGPEGKVPPTDTGRGDHVKDPAFDPATADVPGLHLLGEKQMQFLREWVTDWRDAEMKAVISQTIFTAMATTHGTADGALRADYDSNGWPQTPRNEALKIIRQAFAFHIAGDQHLPALVHYGVEAHRDAGVAFAGPAVNTGYQRWWKPKSTQRIRRGGGDALTGDFTDHFGHPLTVLAVQNGLDRPQDPDVIKFLTNKVSGLGLVRFDKPKRQIIVECWPFLADPTRPGTQFPGWPATLAMTDNYARQAVAHLPTLEISGVAQPVVEVIEERTNERVYVLRLREATFQPPVFAAGKYTIKISEPESGRSRVMAGLVAKADQREKLALRV